MKKCLVDFLTRLNVDRSADVSIDKAFVKGLIIAVFGVQKVKSKDTLSQELKEFIHDLFLFRVGDNENRISSFNSCFDAACREIRQMKKF